MGVKNEKLGILLVGLGAISTTLIAGVSAINQGRAYPIGSLTQLGYLGDEKQKLRIRDYVSFPSLDKIVFGAWDLFSENAYDAAIKANVLREEHLRLVEEDLKAIFPMSAISSREYIDNLDGDNIKTYLDYNDAIKQLESDIEIFKKNSKCSRLVMLWCGSTEKFTSAQNVHSSIKLFQKSLSETDIRISPSMIYAYTAIKQEIPFVNCSPNLACDIPALVQFANKMKVPIAGKDLKTGQTLLKTILAPGLVARLLGIQGWFSTNILGNRDGWVLSNEMNLKTKELSKLGVLDTIGAASDGNLYDDIFHMVDINYYPPRGDDKESWDNIDIYGWLGYPMQIKVNFLCKDSILAAPLLLDLALFMDLAKRKSSYGVQDWLAFYFKNPQTRGKRQPIHGLLEQLNLLRKKVKTWGDK